MIQSYPTPLPDWDDKETEAEFGALERFVTTVRAGRALLNYPPGKSVSLYGYGTGKPGDTLETLHRLRPHIEHLGRGTVELSPEDTWSAKNVLQLTEAGVTVGLVVDHDVDLQKLLERMTKQYRDGVAETTRVTAKLSSADFIAKAPPEVVEEHRSRLQTINHQQDMLKSSEAQIMEMMRTRSSTTP